MKLQPIHSTFFDQHIHKFMIAKYIFNSQHKHNLTTFIKFTKLNKVFCGINKMLNIVFT